MSRGPLQYAEPVADPQSLIPRHERMLERLACRVSRMSGGAVQAEDLWSAGAMGLLEAARRFDASRGIRFEAYAEVRVRGAMLDELRRMDHLPRRLRSEAERVNDYRRKLEASGAGPVSEDALARGLGLSQAHLAELRGILEPALSFEELTTLAAVGESAEERLDDARAKGRLAAAVAQLPERLALILSLRYVEELTLREIGQALKVSEPRVFQLHAQALKLLREAYRSLSRLPPADVAAPR